ncbi:MAG: hypothetical protein VKP57_09870 [Candidatus Sericytochromatia bacterium]|nr:hypothetical protein [Candidatus Sericytochromatia bacterium]
MSFTAASTSSLTGTLRQARTADFAGNPVLGTAKAGQLLERVADQAGPGTDHAGLGPALEARERLAVWLGGGVPGAGASLQDKVDAFLARTGSMQGICDLDQAGDRTLRAALIDRVVHEAFAEGTAETYFHVVLWATEAHACQGDPAQAKAMARLAVDIADWMVEQRMDPLASMGPDARETFAAACRTVQCHPRPDVRILATPVSGSQAMDRPVFASHLQFLLAWLLMAILGGEMACGLVNWMFPQRQVRVVAVQPTNKAASAKAWVDRLATAAVPTA